MDILDIRKKFGTRLFQLRIEAGLTQARLADKSDLSVDLISRIERGERSPSLESIEKIAMALNVNPSQLLNFEGQIFEVLAEGSLEALAVLNLLKGKRPKQIRKVLDITRIVLE